MTATLVDTAPVEPPAVAAPARARWLHVARRAAWWIGVYVAALVIFGAFVSGRHVNPLSMYHAMWESTFTSRYGFGQVLNKAGPFILAALAVAVPARAGLVNIGGEGQVVIGAVAAGGVALMLGEHVTGLPAILLMGIAGAGAGAVWAGIAALLKLFGNVSDAISTLLLNYVGADVLSYLVYGPWKDAAGNGQPVSRPLPAGDFLPTFHALQTHAGIFIALAALGLVAFALARTRWGFALRAVGGNPEAARRAGLAVGPLLVSAMLVGGALAGLGGMVQFSGLEGQLRPGLAMTFGYTGFLASWLGRHASGKVAAAATLLAAIVIAGNALQITSHLPGGAVNILTALILLAVLAQRPVRSKVAP
ncbi:MAG: ral nucleoside transport system permease protein [Frankiaceae bacterium]|jgi:simple sugar transport system permease protein|nr:ral nucleoside transport system permease protein [Frankiaceae bacterium]MDQ1726646.1 ral nucleoside transport system permease protein [Frankiaceae bacterium]